MALHIIPSPPGVAFITCANIYRYKGYTFEWHNYLGPVLCRNDGEPRKRQPGERSPFWPVLKQWQRLPKAKQRKTLIKS